MSKAKNKAKELVDRFKKISVIVEEENATWFKRIGLENAKQCALICVDTEKQTIIDFQNNDDIGHYWFLDDKLKELEEVNQEILKL